MAKPCQTTALQLSNQTPLHALSMIIYAPYAVQASLTKRSKSVKDIPGLDPSPHLQADHSCRVAYPLVMTNIALKYIENHRLQWIYTLNMVIFHDFP